MPCTRAPDRPAPQAAQPPQTLHVCCLCAQWCGVCREFAPKLDAALAELRAQGWPVHARWFDVEDDEALLAPYDTVDNFPTLLVARGDCAVFWGVVTPIASSLVRLLRGLAQAPALPDAGLHTLAQRLVAGPAQGAVSAPESATK